MIVDPSEAKFRLGFRQAVGSSEFDSGSLLAAIGSMPAAGGSLPAASLMALPDWGPRKGPHKERPRDGGESTAQGKPRVICC